MTISPEEAKRLANELLDDNDPVIPAGEPVKGPIGVGSQIGRYRIESLIATGGMGAVYLATHEQPTRTVALKVVRPELLSSSAVRRFRHETELLGRLQHPGIAQIFEADSVRTDLGDQPYFAMEYVEGEPLLDHADDADLGTRDRLELFLKVCDAVEHAHRKGVIHRDLKPGNVLVTEDGQPKVLDFGVAKATDADIQSTTLRTDVGQLVGTLPYMSPEQVGGDAADLDTRSDVYSLGVLLYHLLSGQLPYEIKKGAVPEALRAIQEEDPAPLSGIDKTLRGDVETIVGKALEKDRDRRYQGASDLAGDIRRYLANETITARPASAWYQISRFSKRNRGVVIVGGMLVSSLILGIAGTTGGMFWAMDQRARAEIAEEATQHELTRATEVKRVITEMLGSIRPEEAQGEDVTLLKRILNHTAERLTHGDIEDELIAAELHDVIGDVYRLLGLFDDAEHHLPPALEIRNRVLGEEHPDSTRSMLRLANLYSDLGRYAEAERLNLELLAIRTRVLGAEHEHTLNVVNNLTSVYIKQGRHDEAEPLQLSTLEIRKRVLGEQHLRTLDSMNNLALLYDELGRFNESEALYRKTLEIRSAILGKEHPSTLSTMNNLAVLLRSRGEYSESEALCQETLGIKTRVFGEEHPDTLASLNNLANLYAVQGEYRKAEPLYLKTIRIRTRVLGEEHRSTLAAQNNLANVYRLQGRYADAEPLFVKTLDVRRRVLGEEHPDTLSSMSNLATFLKVQSRFPEATRLHADTLDIRMRVLGKDHPRTLATMNNLANLYVVQGQYAEAESLFRTTLEARMRVLGEQHPNTLATKASIGDLYIETGRFEDASVMFEESLIGFRVRLGTQHSWTRQAMRNLAEAYIELDRRAEALILHRELIDILIAASLEPDASASSINAAANALLTAEFKELNDPVKAVVLAESACAKEEAVDGNKLWIYLHTLALAQHRTGNATRAIITQKRAMSLVPEGEPAETHEEFAADLRTYEAASP